jgi:hypothetical protein
MPVKLDVIPNNGRFSPVEDQLFGHRRVVAFILGPIYPHLNKKRKAQAGEGLAPGGALLNPHESAALRVVIVLGSNGQGMARNVSACCAVTALVRNGRNTCISSNTAQHQGHRE